MSPDFVLLCAHIAVVVFLRTFSAVLAKKRGGSDVHQAGSCFQTLISGGLQEGRHISVDVAICF